MISNIKVGESETINSGLFLGFGSIKIVVEVSYDDWIPALKYSTGKQRLILNKI